jgi:hypothetical protein
LRIGVVGLIHLVQNSNQCWTLVNTVMQLRIRLKEENFFTAGQTTSFLINRPYYAVRGFALLCLGPTTLFKILEICCIKAHPHYSCWCDSLCSRVMWTIWQVTRQATRAARATGSWGSACCRYIKGVRDKPPESCGRWRALISRVQPIHTTSKYMDPHASNWSSVGEDLRAQVHESPDEQKPGQHEHEHE